MSSHLVPAPPMSTGLAAAGSTAQSWGPAPPSDPGLGPQLRRALSAVGRFKWLVLALAVVGTAAGVAVARLLPKRYEVKATIFITQSAPDNGPIRPRELLDAKAWKQLAKSFAILDAVVARMHLWFAPATPGDSAVFAGLRPNLAPEAKKVRPGGYELRIDSAGTGYVLAWTWEKKEYQVERGAVGDSIGREVGFLWAPAAEVLGRGRSYQFFVESPRSVSSRLSTDLEAWLEDDRSNFLWLQLRGDEPRQIAAVLNAVLDEFVGTAAALKRRNLTEYVATLDSQRTLMHERLVKADRALEEFRVNTITLPSENAPVVGGVAETRDPVFRNFFEQKVEYDNIRRDREALEAVLGDIGEGKISADEALLSIPGVLTGSEELKSVLTELSKKKAELRATRQTYTDEHQFVKDIRTSIETIEKTTIPMLALNTLDRLRRREGELGRRIQGASSELQSVPTRTIEEERLKRERDVTSTLYTRLQSSYQEAKLAEASAIADVSVLSPAVAPERPAGDRTVKVIGAAAFASLGFALLLALLLDRTDKRFRYPEQATDEMGLDVIGAVPTIRRSKRGQPTLEETSEIIEAFRSLRLNVRAAFPQASPVMLTVSSPCAGDGKSLLSSNLALSFAEAGYRTVLVDGDIRRGTQHTLFGASQRPGLIDLLAGEATREQVTRTTSHHNLTLIPSGTRRHRGPELLAADGMAKLVRELGKEFDAVIVDSAPLSAGIDPYALGAATGHMLLVLREGETDRQLAQAKLSMLDRLPVRLLGAVLNDFRSPSLYKYYAYLDGYGTMNDEEPKYIGAAGRT